MIPARIKHQQQPTGNTCQSATIAMILNVPVQEVVDEFHDDYLDYKNEPHLFLEERGIGVTYHYAHDRIVDWGNLYMLGVPSLNLEASTHSILFDTRHETNGVCELHDPNRGREGKKHYTHDEDEAKREPLAVLLGAFTICYSFEG